MRESFAGLAALTRLRSLVVRVGITAFRVAALLPLTSLTALTSLVCSWLPADAGDGLEPLEEDAELEFYHNDKVCVLMR